MSEVRYARFTDKGKRFVAVMVQDRILDSESTAAKALRHYQDAFGEPVVLRGARSRRCYGDPGVARRLANLPSDVIIWRSRELH